MTKNKSIHDRLEKSSIRDWNNALEKARKEGNLEAEADIMTSMGNIYRDRGKTGIASKFHKSALEVYATLNDRALVASAYGQLGITYMK